MTAEQIEQRIKESLPGCDVAVMDSTGHGNHYDVRVASQAFAGKTRIQQHKTVMDLFKTEFSTGELHALEIKTLTK